MLEVIYSKKDLKKYEIKFKKNLYYYSVLSHSDKRGYNRTISVSILKNDMHFLTLGEEHVDTAGYKGDLSTANNIISKIMGHKMKDGYDLMSKNIRVINA